jgi:multimeric flavodoxin WrbA
MEEVYKYYMQSDLVLYASPIIMGFTSSLLKTCNDRMIALIHPYAEISEGKLKHMKRYESYPKLGLLLQNDIDTDEEDIQIINDIYSRIASSFSSQFVYSKVINENLLGIVADEVSNL